MPTQSHVAQRVYYDEQHRLEFTANVTEIRELARVEGKPVFQLALDRTAFYPTSGGQPHDVGSLIATARSGALLQAPITDVVEDDAGEVWHTTLKPLQPGTPVTGHIEGWRRMDYMQQHSGQHLLSAIARNEFGAQTVGFHLGERTTTVDLTIELDTSRVARLEEVADQAVAAALPIWPETVPLEEAQRLYGLGVLGKLPERTGAIRLINLGDLDRNACGGTHVANTSHIGPVLLRKVERVRGNSRLTFLCGARALAAARQDWGTLGAVARCLTAAPGDLLERVTRMQAEIKELRRKLRHSGVEPRAN